MKDTHIMTAIDWSTTTSFHGLTFPSRHTNFLCDRRKPRFGCKTKQQDVLVFCFPTKNLSCFFCFERHFHVWVCNFTHRLKATLINRPATLQPIATSELMKNTFYRATHHVKRKMATDSWGRAQQWREWSRLGRARGWTGRPSSASSLPWRLPKPMLPLHSPLPGKCPRSCVVLLSWKYLFLLPSSLHIVGQISILGPGHGGLTDLFLKECRPWLDFLIFTFILLICPFWAPLGFPFPYLYNSSVHTL